MNGNPLDIYCRYIRWTLDTYPTVPSSEYGLLALLEESARRFCGELCFENSRAYVRIWLEYAGLVGSGAAERIFAFMLANNIGLVWPHLYEEYALTLERNSKCVPLPCHIPIMHYLLYIDPDSL